MVGVEGGDAHEAVDPGFRLEVPVGVFARDLDGYALDAGFLARLQVQGIEGVVPGFHPAQVHAHEHFRPVLGLGTARSGVNRNDGVLRVVGRRQHALQRRRLQEALQRPDPFFNLVESVPVVLLYGHFK